MTARAERLTADSAALTTAADVATGYGLPDLAARLRDLAGELTWRAEQNTPTQNAPTHEETR